MNNTAETTEKTRRKPRVAIVSGTSGVGKSTICKKLVQQTGAFLSVSQTTRPKSETELDGEDYWFIPEKEFQDKIANEQFLEYAEVFGNYYGTPKPPVEKALAEGKFVILEIDTQGAMQVKKIYPDAVMIFILPPSHADLAGRMAGRGRGEDTQIAQQRLDSASNEIAAAWQYYDHMVINADLEQAVNEIKQILKENSGNGE